ncbi:MAG TPA: SDR family NAD(P)-dependent oxidoreductase, partial [Lentzea sp.]
MGSLEGRAALVTGGSRGIGAAVAEKLAALGARVAVTYQNTKPDNGFAIQADSEDPQAVVAAVEETAAEFGRLDILVNNAGVFQV